MNLDIQSANNGPSTSVDRGDFQIIINMINFLESLDNLLTKTAREAQSTVGNSGIFSVSEADFQRLVDAKDHYHKADYSVEAISVYLQQLPELDEFWDNICRVIVRYCHHDPSRVGEWRFWLRQLERAGTLAWTNALYAVTSITIEYPEQIVAIFNGIIHKLAVVDEALNEIHIMVHGRDSKREAQFESELRDSIEAFGQIVRQGAAMTTESLQNFKMSIRTGRAAAQNSSGGSTTGFQLAGVVSPETSHLRHPASVPEPTSLVAEDHQDRPVGDEAKSLNGIHADDPSHKYDPTVLMVVVTLTIVAVGLTGFACSRADHTVGSFDDADFWFLLQSSVLQVAGMVPVLFSLAIIKDAPLQPRIWSWFCLGSGVILSFIAPVLYLIAPTEYSGVVACAGSIAQVLMILEAMFLVTHTRERDGPKVKSS